MALRLLLFDRTCVGRGVLPGLSDAWRTGARLYQRLGRLDAAFGAADWSEGLTWLSGYRGDEPVAEIQLWMHGNWGRARIGGGVLDASALVPGHRYEPALRAVRERLTPGALWWFRTCETFGAEPGYDFARRWTDFFGCAAAGHTFIIGHWQSGLHRLAPGNRPTWSTREGLARGTPAAPQRARRSHPAAPNTITCWHGTIPPGY